MVCLDFDLQSSESQEKSREKHLNLICFIFGYIWDSKDALKWFEHFELVCSSDSSIFLEHCDMTSFTLHYSSPPVSPGCSG